ncbi:MAG: MaoC family dehydratase N-terminal domain-containing protein, partial [Burkholderiales bacterium]|nr:MaoC family dehydratase N-terminal domain-containing protein [Burkholderiales bacterium]
MDQQHLQQWIGRREQRADRISQSTVAAMAATLDRDRFDVRAGVDVPPLWHWAFFTPLTPAREIGPDGHAKRGDFLPPVSLPRRMWAGGRLVFHHPLRVGEEITRTSRIANVDTKEGRTGPLVFVTVHHEIANASGVAITEEHDIVYREDPRPDAAPAPLQPAPEGAAFTREITPDPVL